MPTLQSPCGSQRLKLPAAPHPVCEDGVRTDNALSVQPAKALIAATPFCAAPARGAARSSIERCIVGGKATGEHGRETLAQSPWVTKVRRDRTVRPPLRHSGYENGGVEK